MEVKYDKIFVHFDTNEVNIYTILDGKLNLFKKQQIFFNETLVNNELIDKIDTLLNDLSNIVGDLNSKTTRLYATGIFQEFSQEEQMQIIIHIYVSNGLYFNIIQSDLEQFYLLKSFESKGDKNLFHGLILQEFRRVVVCGSFQKHMKEINALIDVLKKQNIQVLSPWTQNVVLESLGTDFILLEGQSLVNERDAWRHKYDHMNKFSKADAIVVCNPGGTIGKGTMFEFGFMIARAKRIIFTEEPKGLSILFPYEVGLNIG